MRPIPKCFCVPAVPACPKCSKVNWANVRPSNGDANNEKKLAAKLTPAREA